MKRRILATTIILGLLLSAVPVNAADDAGSIVAETSEFEVAIPKTVSLDASTGQAKFEVRLNKAEFREDEYVYVEPEKGKLESEGKESKDVDVSVDNILCLTKDYPYFNATYSAQKTETDAGKWTGHINFKISLETTGDNRIAYEGLSIAGHSVQGENIGIRIRFGEHYYSRQISTYSNKTYIGDKFGDYEKADKWIYSNYMYDKGRYNEEYERRATTSYCFYLKGEYEHFKAGNSPHPNDENAMCFAFAFDDMPHEKNLPETILQFQKMGAKTERITTGTYTYHNVWNDDTCKDYVVKNIPQNSIWVTMPEVRVKSRQYEDLIIEYAFALENNTFHDNNKPNSYVITVRTEKSGIIFLIKESVYSDSVRRTGEWNGKAVA